MDNKITKVLPPFEQNPCLEENSIGDEPFTLVPFRNGVTRAQQQDSALGTVCCREGGASDVESRLTTVAAMDLRLRTALQEFAWSALKTRFARTSASLYFAGFFLASCNAASEASLGSVASASAARPTK